MTIKLKCPKCGNHYYQEMDYSCPYCRNREQKAAQDLANKEAKDRAARKDMDDALKRSRGFL